MYFYVFIVPKTTVGQWRVIRAWVNRAIAGIDDPPAAFGAVTGPILTGSKRISYRGFLLMSGKRLLEIRDQIIDRFNADG